MVKCPYCFVDINEESIICANCKQHVKLAFDLAKKIQPGTTEKEIPQQPTLKIAPESVLVVMFILLVIVPPLALIYFFKDEAKNVHEVVLDVSRVFVLIAVSLLAVASLLFTRVNNIFILGLVTYIGVSLIRLSSYVIELGSTSIYFRSIVNDWVYQSMLAILPAGLIALIFSNTLSFKKIYSFTAFLKWFYGGQDFLDRVGRTLAGITGIIGLIYSVVTILKTLFL